MFLNFRHLYLHSKPTHTRNPLTHKTCAHTKPTYIKNKTNNGFRKINMSIIQEFWVKVNWWKYLIDLLLIKITNKTVLPGSKLNSWVTGKRHCGGPVI